MVDPRDGRASFGSGDARLSGGFGVNGQHQQSQPSPPTTDTPLAYYQPVAITGGTIKWIAGAIASVMMFLAASPVADRWMMPAKDSELKALQGVVETVRTQQTDFQRQMESSRDAIARLVLAVDNLSSIVSDIKNQKPRTIIQKATR